MPLEMFFKAKNITTFQINLSNLFFIGYNFTLLIDNHVKMQNNVKELKIIVNKHYFQVFLYTS